VLLSPIETLLLPTERLHKRQQELGALSLLHLGHAMCIHPGMLWQDVLLCKPSEHAQCGNVVNATVQSSMCSSSAHNTLRALRTRSPRSIRLKLRCRYSTYTRSSIDCICCIAPKIKQNGPSAADASASCDVGVPVNPLPCVPQARGRARGVDGGAGGFWRGGCSAGRRINNSRLHPRGHRRRAGHAGK